MLLCSQHDRISVSDMRTAASRPSLPSPPCPSSSTATRTLIAVSLKISILFLFRQSPATALPGNGAPRFPAVIVFGDSIVDPGNNNNIKTLVKCNFSPYGRDFMGGIPTGRFSNGRIPSDFLAELCGVKEHLTAYLDPNLSTDDLLTGVSFASGATGYDPLTPKIASAISLPDQLNLFKEYVGKITAAVGEEQAAAIVAESLYIVVCGSDDIANTYFTTPFRRAHYDIPSYTDLMVDQASSFFQGLYGQGARMIGVIGVPPIGCVPSQRTLEGGLDRRCSESENQAALLFNSKLSSKIDALNSQLPGCRLVFLDIYPTVLDIIRNPSKYGFEVGDRGCCGTGNIEVSVLCTRLSDAKTCEDDTKFVFWDSYHPTERTYKIVTTEAYNNFMSKIARYDNLSNRTG